MTVGQLLDLLVNVNRDAEVRLAVRPCASPAQAEVYGATDELISVEHGQPRRVVYLLDGGELGSSSPGLWEMAV